MLDPVAPHSLSVPGRPDADWSLTVHPGARKTSGGFIASYRPPHAVGVRGQAADPEGALQHAGGRARGKLRRYRVANELNWCGAMTYRGSGFYDPRQVRAYIADYFRTLHAATGGKTFPCVWVTGWHTSGNGKHAPFRRRRLHPAGHHPRRMGSGVGQPQALPTPVES